MTDAPAIPTFATDPVAYLQAIGSHTPAPSLEALQQLGGLVAISIKTDGANVSSNVAVLYLQASAKHLSILSPDSAASRASSNMNHANHHPAASALPPPGTGPQSILLSAASAVQQDTGGINSEQSQTQLLHLISEALTFAAVQCQHRSDILDSGILTVLQRFLPSNRRTSNSLITPDAPLTPVQADYLQLMLYAGQAQAAQRVIADTWPRPTKGINVRTVLRYFYLRGLVHVECQNWTWAKRCFWTCLCIPADVTSALVVAAWKKLVLLQALSQSDRPPVEMAVLRTPKTTPVCVSRFINQAISSYSSGSSKSPPESGIVSAPEDSTAVGLSSTTYLLHQDELIMANGFSFPNATSAPPADTNIEAGVRAYAELVRAFVAVDRLAFTQVMNENQLHFAQDGNVSLTQLVQNELVKRQIYQWSRVFSVIPLDRLSELMSMPVPEIENLLRLFAQQTQWRIEVKDGMAYFPKHEPVLDSSSHAEDLSKLTEMMQKLDVTLSTSSKFLALMKRDSSSTATGDAKSSVPRGVEDV